MINFKRHINEMFDLVQGIVQIGTEEFFKYAYEMYCATTDNPRSFEDATPELFKRYGYKVKAFKFKNYLIIYGLYPISKRYEVHFWDIERHLASGVSNKGFSDNIFSAVMTVIIEQHLNKRNEDLYIIFKDDSSRGDLYIKLVNKMLIKNNLNDKYSVTINTENIVISKNSEV